MPDCVIPSLSTCSGRAAHPVARAPGVQERRVGVLVEVASPAANTVSLVGEPLKVHELEKYHGLLRGKYLQSDCDCDAYAPQVLYPM